MKINLDGLSVADYRISLRLADGRVPSGLTVYPSTAELTQCLINALKASGLSFYTMDCGICVFDGRFPVDALAERLASALENDGHVVERTVTEPRTTGGKAIQSFILF